VDKLSKIRIFGSKSFQNLGFSAELGKILIVLVELGKMSNLDLKFIILLNHFSIQILNIS